MFFLNKNYGCSFYLSIMVFFFFFLVDKNYNGGLEVGYNVPSLMLTTHQLSHNVGGWVFIGMR